MARAAQRNIPDVAMDRCTASGSSRTMANPTGGGAISLAAPSGFAAMMNQYAASTARPPSVSSTRPFMPWARAQPTIPAFTTSRPVITGTASSPPNFFATTGYDLCTGWGTPNGANLITALLPNNPPRSRPRGGFTAAGAVGRADLARLPELRAGATPLRARASGRLPIRRPGSRYLAGGGTLAARCKNQRGCGPQQSRTSLPFMTHTATVWFTNVNLHTAQRVSS